MAGRPYEPDRGVIVALLNYPRSPQDWDVWSMHHRISHSLIIDTARSKRNTQLVDYQLDPIPASDTTSWLQRNQQAHAEMLAVVGAQSVDLQDVDINDERQMQAWLYLHYLDHQTTEQRLGVGS